MGPRKAVVRSVATAHQTLAPSAMPTRFCSPSKTSGWRPGTAICRNSVATPPNTSSKSIAGRGRDQRDHNAKKVTVVKHRKCPKTSTVENGSATCCGRGNTRGGIDDNSSQASTSSETTLSSFRATRVWGIRFSSIARPKWEKECLLSVIASRQPVVKRPHLIQPPRRLGVA